MKSKTEKVFDAVKMMREIRAKLVDDYLINPAKEEQELERIRKKFNMERRPKKSA